MKRTMLIVLALTFVMAGCAQQSDLASLEQRISDMETELADAARALDASEDALESATKIIEVTSDAAVSEVNNATTEGISEVEDAATQASNNLLEAVQTITEATTDIRSIRNDLTATQDELLETRIWVGDLAHCLIYEADLGSYDYWEATSSGTPGFANRGEWGHAIPGMEAQMSHCSR